jgi:tetratricopeptide (TPR) repeat protein
MAHADQIADEAYRAWELNELSTAAELFLNAAAVEREEAMRRTKWSAPDSSVLHRLRAGFCLFEAGEHDRALDLLKEGINFDWKAARLWGDRRDAEKCHVCHILHYASLGDSPRYSHHVKLATADGERLDVPFPWSLPVKRQAITAAMVMEDSENLRKWVASVDPHSRTKQPELGLLCAQVERKYGRG